jgi:hypothetical protein
MCVVVVAAAAVVFEQTMDVDFRDVDRDAASKIVSTSAVRDRCLTHARAHS